MSWWTWFCKLCFSGVLGIYYPLNLDLSFMDMPIWMRYLVGRGRFWNLPELELVHWELIHRGVKPTLVVTVHFYTVNLFTWVGNWIICVSVQFICVCVCVCVFHEICLSFVLWCYQTYKDDKFFICFEGNLFGPILDIWGTEKQWSLNGSQLYNFTVTNTLQRRGILW